MKSQERKTSIQLAIEKGHLLPLGQWRLLDREIPLFASHTLWQTLLWPYPSSSPRDRLQLHHLQADVARRLECLTALTVHAFFYPGRMPQWLNPDFAIKIERHFVSGVLTRLILLMPDDYSCLTTM